MKKILFTLCLILSGVMAISQVSLKIKSGDTELDASLNEINIKAEKDYSLFKTEMKTTYKITDAKIDLLKITYGMAASDIFMTLELVKLTGKSMEDIADVFKEEKGKGWGEIAKSLGIKPGSKEFHALKGTAGEKGKGNDKSENGKGNAGGAKGTPGEGKGNGKGKK